LHRFVSLSLIGFTPEELQLQCQRLHTEELRNAQHADRKGILIHSLGHEYSIADCEAAQPAYPD
jgi:hypothetical protein